MIQTMMEIQTKILNQICVGLKYEKHKISLHVRRIGIETGKLKIKLSTYSSKPIKILLYV